MAIKIPTADASLGTYPGGGRAPYQSANAMTAEGVPQELLRGFTERVAGMRSLAQSQRAAAAGMGDAAMRKAETLQQAISFRSRAMGQVGAAEVDVARMQGQYAQGMVQAAHNTAAAAGQASDALVSGGAAVGAGQRAYGQGLQNLAASEGDLAKMKAQYGDSYGAVAQGMMKQGQGYENLAASQGRATEMEMRGAHMRGQAQQGLIQYADTMIANAARETQAAYALGKSLGAAGEAAMRIGLDVLELMRTEKDKADTTQVLEAVQKTKEAKIQKWDGELLRLEGDAVRDIQVDEKTKSGVVDVGMQFFDNTVKDISENFLRNNNQRAMYAAKIATLRSNAYEELFQHQTKQLFMADNGAILGTQRTIVGEAMQAARMAPGDRGPKLSRALTEYVSTFWDQARTNKWAPGRQVEEYRTAMTKFWYNVLDAALEKGDTKFVGDVIRQFDDLAITQDKNSKPWDEGALPVFLDEMGRGPQIDGSGLIEKIRKRYRPVQEKQEATLAKVRAQDLSRGVLEDGWESDEYYSAQGPVDHQKADQILTETLNSGKYPGQEEILKEAIKENLGDWNRTKGMQHQADTDLVASLGADIEKSIATRGVMPQHLSVTDESRYNALTPAARKGYEDAYKAGVSSLNSRLATGETQYQLRVKKDKATLNYRLTQARRDAGYLGVAELTPEELYSGNNPDTGQPFTIEARTAFESARGELLQQGRKRVDEDILSHGGKKARDASAAVWELLNDLKFQKAKTDEPSGTAELLHMRIMSNLFGSADPNDEQYASAVITPDSIRKAFTEAMKVYTVPGVVWNGTIRGYELAKPERLQNYRDAVTSAQKKGVNFPMFKEEDPEKQDMLRKYRDIIEARYGPQSRDDIEHMDPLDVAEAASALTAGKDREWMDARAKKDHKRQHKIISDFHRSKRNNERSGKFPTMGEPNVPENQTLSPSEANFSGSW